MYGRADIVGTFNLKGEELVELIIAAVKLGYRSIDTAASYRNESDVGKAVEILIRDKVVRRDEIWITSKIDPYHHGFDRACTAIEQSLSNLKCSYIDLMLIHWPGTKRLKHSDPKNATNRRETLRAMETYLASGQIRNIGVSNYFAQHLDDQTLSKIKVNQIEFHPFLWTERTQQLLALCRKNGVHVTAYSPLGQAQFMQNESIVKLATMANVSPAQLMLNWAVSKGCSIIPKTSTFARLQENMDAVNMDIADEILKSVDNIVSIYGEKRVCWDPSTVV